MVNTLTRQVGATFGPIVLETLVKHYFERLRKEVPDGKNTTRLRQDELLYDQAFNIVKNFLAAASLHTVEDCQSFANTRTPSPPWVRVVRVLVPMSSCDDAAEYLIRALGGDEVVKRTVGGTKWWQVRGVNGVDSQWIVAKKDWREARKRYKEQEKQKDSKTSGEQNGSWTPNGSHHTGHDPDPESETYQQDMDEMRCILYSHGGGYYFGSVDQERYSIQRHARKINGRVFAINYRLAPQYPFPCAIQDVLAAYLFLIRPPPEALHRPVKPAHIILAGDSAGGGITLALLQVLRDTELPLPAGAILISPWCDLTHSFPSIHTNTNTDVIPEYGLSMQKPSTLWPPPSDEMTRHVHASLRDRIRQMVRLNRGEKVPDLGARPKTTSHRKPSSITVTADREKRGPDDMPVDVGTTATAPPLNAPENQTISLIAKSGETLTINQQVHLYTQNSLIVHPLISPVLSYLGGLPPLLIIASDKEVLRDEIIYTAHKAANPSKYRVKDESRVMYPSLEGIEGRFGPTPVHLQVYDDAAHVLPVLFSFTTPAKFCFRAMATFCKHVIKMAPESQPPVYLISSSPIPFTLSPQTSTPNLNEHPNGTSQILSRTKSDVGSSKSPSETNTSQSLLGLPSSRSTKSLKRRLSQAVTAIRGNGAANSSGEKAPPVPNLMMLINKETEDVAGPRFNSSSSATEDQRKAGEAIVYSDSLEFPSWHKGMIRERVSTRGIIRPLELESELDAFHVPQEIIGDFSELAIRRYLNAKVKFDKKFSGVQKVIDKRRRRNLELSKKDISRNMAQLQEDVSKHTKESKERRKSVKGLKEGLEASSGSWSWAWALESDERPPPSSIVSRRDTQEARELAKIADQSSLEDEGSISGNQLWSMLVDFLTSPPGKNKYLGSTALYGDQSGVSTLSKSIPERKETASRESAEHIFMKT